MKFLHGILIASLLLVVIGCQVSEDTAKQTLQGAGYTEIHLTGWAPLACSEEDTLSQGFTAKGPSGLPVEGTVCCGLVFKNCTIRF